MVCGSGRITHITKLIMGQKNKILFSAKGVIYHSLADAAEALDMSRKMIWTRIHSPKHKDFFEVPIPIPTEKRCSKCGNTKPIDEFGFSRPKVRRADCKKCQNLYNKEYLMTHPVVAAKIKKNVQSYRKVYNQVNKAKRGNYLRHWAESNTTAVKARKLKYKYGISLDDYDYMMEKQGFCCMLCDKEFQLHKGRYSAHVDHDHKTGKIRGLLCFQCNIGLGSFKDDQAILSRAIRYIEHGGYANLEQPKARMVTRGE